ncbi:sulfurtransferase complex subunit TusD [Vibrio sp. SS-MA-C1-2]|uniref:sulfurtransferase complex subunit TusD n=1 Tax=Vibrio sp. SS-MA-C1-2 TaxID=2908646 RepID=UPI001F4201A6|nr:sulfurtransferase complex subunit TusD [Vibrio sp. SS-MA-C1-2]UJF19201.1 sulfurtransferase complex subunit TusD [Vibrio sp. SS-MA-C1-2]
MSLHYGLVVNGSAYGSQQARAAYQFALAIIEEGHQLDRIFFYQDGVYNGSEFTAPASDEFDIVAGWQKLASEHQVELQTCVAAALRRGILSDDEAKSLHQPHGNLAEHFTQSGLGSMAEMLLKCDRVIQF